MYFSPLLLCLVPITSISALAIPNRFPLPAAAATTIKHILPKRTLPIDLPNKGPLSVLSSLGLSSRHQDDDEDEDENTQESNSLLRLPLKLPETGILSIIPGILRRAADPSLLASSSNDRQENDNNNDADNGPLQLPATGILSILDGLRLHRRHEARDAQLDILDNLISGLGLRQVQVEEVDLPLSHDVDLLSGIERRGHSSPSPSGTATSASTKSKTKMTASTPTSTKMEGPSDDTDDGDVSDGQDSGSDTEEGSKGRKDQQGRKLKAKGSSQKDKSAGGNGNFELPDYLHGILDGTL